MAEIRSTMDMVLERAERLCSQAHSPAESNYLQDGMKAGAQMLQDESFDLTSLLGTLPAESTSQFISGILVTLLRNITLPRYEGTPWQPAMNAIERLSDALKGDTSQLKSMLSEINNILGRYHEHRQQVTTQLEEAFTAQAAQLQQNTAQQSGRQMDISPAQHPKFNEELQKHFDQLSEQYTNALSQYKEAITQLFTQV